MPCIKLVSAFRSQAASSSAICSIIIKCYLEGKCFLVILSYILLAVILVNVQVLFIAAFNIDFSIFNFKVTVLVCSILNCDFKVQPVSRLQLVKCVIIV